MYMLKINGVDITPFIKPRMSYAWNALDGENASRTLDGTMHRDYICDKEKIELSLIPMHNADFWQLSDLIRGGQDLTVTYQGDRTSAVRTLTCYSTSFQGNCYSTAGGKTIWTDTAFNLIEK